MKTLALWLNSNIIIKHYNTSVFLRGIFSWSTSQLIDNEKKVGGPDILLIRDDKERLDLIVIKF